METFNTKVSAYLKSKAKNKIHLVEDLVKYLDDLESQYQQLLTAGSKNTLRCQLLKRRITLYTTDVICMLVEAEDWAGLRQFEARNCCEWFEVITIISIYKPDKLHLLIQGCKECKQHLQDHTEEWQVAADKEQLPQLGSFIQQMIEEQDHEMIQVQFTELSKKLNVDKKKLRQMLLEMDL